MPSATSSGLCSGACTASPVSRGTPGGCDQLIARSRCERGRRNGNAGEEKVVMYAVVLDGRYLCVRRSSNGGVG
jgi:hypothetical protein